MVVGVVRIDANKSLGLVRREPIPFQSLLDIARAIEKCYVDHGIQLHPSKRGAEVHAGDGLARPMDEHDFFTGWQGAFVIGVPFPARNVSPQTTVFGVNKIGENVFAESAPGHYVQVPGQVSIWVREGNELNDRRFA